MKEVKIISKWCEEEENYCLGIEGVEGGFFNGDHAIQEVLGLDSNEDYESFIRDFNGYTGKGQYAGYYFQHEEDADLAADYLNNKYKDKLTIENVEVVCDDYGATFKGA